MSAWASKCSIEMEMGARERSVTLFQGLGIVVETTIGWITLLLTFYILFNSSNKITASGYILCSFMIGRKYVKFERPGLSVAHGNW